MIVTVKDSLTRLNPEGAQVYLDGGYRGAPSTGDGAGVLVIQDVKPGTHTLRVTSPGYKEITPEIYLPGRNNH